jgi:GNAT superfamily N-acetyltransferase
MQMRGMLLFTQPPQKPRSANHEEQKITRSTTYLKRVSIQPLQEEDDELLDIAARWAEQKWGYITAVGRDRVFSFDECIEARKNLIRELMNEPHGFYIMMMDVLGELQPVGMFSLRAWHDKPNLGFNGVSEPSLSEEVETGWGVVDEASLIAGLVLRGATADPVVIGEEKNDAAVDSVAAEKAAQVARLQAHLQSVMELDYVYLDENKRDFGLGGLLVRYAKEVAKARGCNTLVLDTLNPVLNRFYKSQGAHVLLESSHHTIPTEKLSIDLRPDRCASSRQETHRDHKLR